VRQCAGCGEAECPVGDPWPQAAAAGAIGGATIVLTAKAVIDVPTGIIAVVSLIVLVTWKPKEPFVVLAAGILGLVLYPVFVT